jgi:hypothetical protein
VGVLGVEVEGVCGGGGGFGKTIDVVVVGGGGDGSRAFGFEDAVGGAGLGGGCCGDRLGVVEIGIDRGDVIGLVFETIGDTTETALIGVLYVVYEVAGD